MKNYSTEMLWHFQNDLLNPIKNKSESQKKSEFFGRDLENFFVIYQGLRYRHISFCQTCVEVSGKFLTYPLQVILPSIPFEVVQRLILVAECNLFTTIDLK